MIPPQITALTGLKRHACPLFLMLFPLFDAHISVAEFQYPDLIWKKMCGRMAHLVAGSGGNKGQLGNLVDPFYWNKQTILLE